jgi:hypothetical protein
MQIELNEEERQALLRLVDAAVRDIGPEIRHTMTSTYKDDLKQERRTLRALHDRLSASAETEPPVASRGYIGTI